MTTTATATITPEQKQAYQRDGYFVLEAVIPPDHLEMLREEAAKYIERIHAQMDAAGKDVIGINHRNSRYFISN